MGPKRKGNSKMTTKQKIGCFTGLIALVVNLPIYFYLWYSLLKLTGAPDLTWFLFWLYTALTVVISSLGEIAKALAEE